MPYILIEFTNYDLVPVYCQLDIYMHSCGQILNTKIDLGNEGNAFFSFDILLSGHFSVQLDPNHFFKIQINGLYGNMEFLKLTTDYLLQSSFWHSNIFFIMSYPYSFSCSTCTFKTSLLRVKNSYHQSVNVLPIYHEYIGHI